MNTPDMKGLASTRRRAVVAVQVIVLLTVLMGFATLTIDVGTLYRARGELQDAADAGALAAASALLTDEMLQVRVGTGGAAEFAIVESVTSERANTFAMLNNTLGDPTLVETADISTGWIDVTSATSGIVGGVPAVQRNAVRVEVRRASDGGDESNGPIQYFFAPIFGHSVGESSASAVAVFDDRYEGFDVGDGGANLVPVTIDEPRYLAALGGGGDDYTYDPDAGTVLGGSDGLREINLAPHNYLPGNFGWLNVGAPNQGIPQLRDRIENGITPEQLETEIGTSEMTFYDDGGAQITYDISGNPGMKAALASSFETLIGQVVAFFVHTGRTGNGANSVYTISEIRFGRLMDVRLNGNPAQRGIWVQPIIYSGGGVKLGPAAPSSGGMVGRLVLAR